MERKVRVKAGDGLKVFLPLDVLAAPGRKIKVLEGDETVEVPLDTRYVRRRLKVGDLVVVESDQPRPPESEAMLEETTIKPGKADKRRSGKK